MNIFDVKVGGDGASLETPFGAADALALAEPMAAARIAWCSAFGRPMSALASRRARLERTTVQQLEPLGDVTVVSLVSNSQPFRMVLPEAQAVEHQGRRSASDHH